MHVCRMHSKHVWRTVCAQCSVHDRVVGGQVVVGDEHVLQQQPRGTSTRTFPDQQQPVIGLSGAGGNTSSNSECSYHRRSYHRRL